MTARCISRRPRSRSRASIPLATEEVDPDLLFTQTFIDQARLIETIRTVLPERSSALLSDVIAMHPIEQGAAEIVGYLTLNDEEVTVSMDDADESAELFGPRRPGHHQTGAAAESDGAATMSNEHAVASAIIRLMQGVVYRESDGTPGSLERLGAGVRDHFATIGVDVVVDDAEGYAYLRSGQRRTAMRRCRAWFAGGH